MNTLDVFSDDQRIVSHTPTAHNGSNSKNEKNNFDSTCSKTNGKWQQQNGPRMTWGVKWIPQSSSTASTLSGRGFDGHKNKLRSHVKVGNPPTHHKLERCGNITIYNLFMFCHVMCVTSTQVKRNNICACHPSYACTSEHVPNVLYKVGRQHRKHKHFTNVWLKHVFVFFWGGVARHAR